MDKVILKKFAIESRKDLMDKVRSKIKTFYVDEEFNSEQKGDIYILSNNEHSLSLTNEEFKKRELLIKRIKELSLEQVVEEAAYTWFNRIIAIRYMEINDYLPLTKDNQSLGIRVLSSKDNTPDPEILKFTNLINPYLDINFKKEKYVELKDDNEKFKYVLLLVCKKLGRVIPQVFDGITDYIDILIPDNLLNDTGFITKVINEVPVENYNQVEIIGWLYQYYNQTEKDRVMNAKKNYKKNEVPYVTQLFTPDWIVKYMVENSLGRYWIEHSNATSIYNNWKYYLSNDYIECRESINPQNIKFIDPCCGSGHILVYAFEIFYQIYESIGYSKNDISEAILENNIYGMDIDDRAKQLSILSVLLKAREYDRNIFNKKIVKNLNIVSFQETNLISNTEMLSEKIKNEIEYLTNLFKDSKAIGSLIKLDKKIIDVNNIKLEINKDNTIFGIELRNKILPIIKQYEILAQKYDIVVTNPPYMGNRNMNIILSDYAKKEYKKSKLDMSTMFMEKNEELVKDNGYVSMINIPMWLNISKYEQLRYDFFEKVHIINLLYFGRGVFGSDFGSTAFVLKKGKNLKYKGKYYELFKEVGKIDTIEEKEKMFFERKKETEISLEELKSIPGFPISYSINKRMIQCFSNMKNISDYADVITGITTGNNDLFIKLWYEVDINNIGLNYSDINKLLEDGKKYIPYNKGGDNRKWYGNNEYVVNWTLKDKFNRPKTTMEKYYLKDGLTWSFFSFASFSLRSFSKGFLWDVIGSPMFLYDNKNKNKILGLLNSKVGNEFLKIINPTVAFQAVDIQKVPVDEKIFENSKIDELVDENVKISKYDWDFYETSWDFFKHPLLKFKGNLICEQMVQLKDKCKTNREILIRNEEKLNEIFLNYYELDKLFNKNIDNRFITISEFDKEREIKSLISYAVGCMFGRYSLDKEGLIYAGGDFDEIYKKHKKTDGGWAGVSLANYKVLNDNGQEIDLSFEVDNDNVIPITDEAYFSDDIVERFKTFISVVYGEKTLNENLDFIAETLGKKGTETSEDTIRRYFVNDFFNDHVKTYQKRPIYWLFDSGKKNGFKALVYMHRYNENLIPKVRLDYLHRMQTTYEKLLADVNHKLTSELSMTDKKEAQKRQADLNAKLQEIKEYDEKIAHIANQRISIDLDDGVKVNYDKFKDILAKIK